MNVGNNPITISRGKIFRKLQCSSVLPMKECILINLYIQVSNYYTIMHYIGYIHVEKKRVVLIEYNLLFYLDIS